ncbi:MAG: carotenoid oxygenase family protein, partial [Actinocatenispora sp.]
EFQGIWGAIGGSAAPAAAATGAVLHRWRLDPATGAVTETRLDDRAVEFPTINDDLTGRPSRYRYAVGDTTVVKYDVRTGISTARELDGTPGEMTFVPAADGRAEDDGWLLSIVTDEQARGSELVVLGARDLDRVASVRLPRRVPDGFHGTWLPDD